MVAFLENYQDEDHLNYYAYTSKFVYLKLTENFVLLIKNSIFILTILP